jgi:hypothetical protein
MADVIEGAGQEFWRPPSVAGAAEAGTKVGSVPMAEACHGCGSEFLIGARFCHTCGGRRVALAHAVASAEGRVAGVSGQSLVWLRASAGGLGAAWGLISFPPWTRYFHFHEIKGWIGLPTASLVSFLAGLGCLAGAVGVSLFYKASSLAEFQAIQLWRIEWLLAATAAFVAGILLKKPADR